MFKLQRVRRLLFINSLFSFFELILQPSNLLLLQIIFLLQIPNIIIVHLFGLCQSLLCKFDLIVVLCFLFAACCFLLRLQINDSLLRPVFLISDSLLELKFISFKHLL